MQKKPPLAIAGWRQVMLPAPKPRSVLVSRGKAARQPPAAPAERSAKDRWEDEGGHLDKAKLPPIVAGD
jgi:hypothetical protein